MSPQQLRLRYRLQKDDLKNGEIDVDRLQRQIEDIIKAIKSNYKAMLEEMGEQVLDWARRNAEFYYAQGGAQFTGNRVEPFKPRHAATKILYERSPFHTEMPGLSSGQNKLIESLLRSGADNIFSLSGNMVTVGTKNHRALLLEDGGPRPPRRHVGRGPSGKVYLGPGPEGDVETPETILARFGADFYIPPRPFLKPALWHLRDAGDGKVLQDILIWHIQDVISKVLPEVEVSLE